MIRFTCPSTAPELNGRLNPATTAPRSEPIPFTNDTNSGRPAAFTWSIQLASWVRPVRAVIISAKVRTWSAVASNSGQRVRMPLSLRVSSEVRLSGWRVIQLVTSRTEAAGWSGPAVGCRIAGDAGSRAGPSVRLSSRRP